MSDIDAPTHSTGIPVTQLEFDAIENKLRIAELESVSYKKALDAQNDGKVNNGMVKAAHEDTEVSCIVVKPCGDSYELTCPLLGFTVASTPTGNKITLVNEDGDLEVSHLGSEFQVNYTHRLLTEEIFLSYKEQVEAEIKDEADARG